MNWRLLSNSLLLAASATVSAVAVGALGALWLSTLQAGWRRLCLALAVIALALPPFLVTNCWLDLLGQTGRWRAWVPANIYSLPGAVWILTLLLWPITLLLVLGDLQKLEPSQLESDCALRGSSLIRWLLLPMARPAIAQAAVLTFALALNNFAVPAILQTKVFPAELWVSFNTTFDYWSALQLSWPLWIIPLLLLAFLGRASVSWPRAEGGVAPELFRCQLGTWWSGATMSALILVMILSVAVPLADLILTRRTWLELPSAFAAGQHSIWNSFLYATLAASLSTAAGWVAWRWRAGALLWLPFLLPGVLLGIVLIFLFNRGWLIVFYQSAGIVMVGLVLRYSALSWSGTRQAMQATDGNLADFARLNGASRMDLMRHVYWPQIAPATGAVWFVTYLLCLWDVETLVLIVPPGGETLALRIFNLLHYGHNAQVNALCVLSLALALLPLGAWTALKLKTADGHAPGSSAIRNGAGRSQVILLAFSSAAVFSTGCGPAPSNQAPIDSRLFSRVEIIGSRGTALGQFNKPRSVAVDSRDNLYVVDMTGRVQKFSSNGTYLSSWQMPQTEKGKPKGMCRDRAGNIIVVEPHYTRVNHFSPEGKLLAQWGTPGTNDGQLCLPRAAVVNSRGDILVCEYTVVDRVQEFSALGKQWKLTIGHSGLKPGEFNRPEGLGIDAQDRIYVADSCNHRVQIFSSDGTFLRTYGQAGSGLGELSYPYDVQVDAAGLQFVCEFGNSRVQIFDQQDKPLEILGGTGPAPGQFNNPWSLAFDSAGNLYVADSQNHRVQKFIRKAPVGGNRQPVAGAAGGSHLVNEATDRGSRIAK